VIFALLYFALRRLFGWAAGPSSVDQSKDVEILVLRHQLKILRRQAGRPKLRRIDRAVLAAAGRACLDGPGRRSSWLRVPSCAGTGSSRGGSGPSGGLAAAAARRWIQRSSIR
jgi:hypothetical protein